LSRCFFYVSDILRQVIENGGIQGVKAKKQRKTEFSLNDEDRCKLQASEKPMSVSEISDYLNSLVDTNISKKISAATINNWLLSLQFLELVVQQDGKNRKLPTDQGRELGIFTEEKIGQYGKYVIVLFSQPAQQFIFDNIDAIAGYKKEKND